MSRHVLYGVWAATLLAAACGGEDPPPLALPGQVILSEVASSNPGGGSGAARDERGEYDDWIELFNTTDQRLNLAGLWVSDHLPNPSRYKLPEDPPTPIDPFEHKLLFADGETFQGTSHLPFSLDKDGEAVSVSTSTGSPIAALELPAMLTGESYALLDDGLFTICGTPTPGAANNCDPVEPPYKKEYAPYTWPEPWPPALTAAVVISEIDAHGTGSNGPYVELRNQSSAPVDLSSLILWIAASPFPQAAPRTPSGDQIGLSGTLEPGAVKLVAAPSLDPLGCVVGLSGPGEALWDREVYEAIAPNSVLALADGGGGIRLACDLASATPDAVNGPCAPPAPRSATPHYLSKIRSDADLLAVGEAAEEVNGNALSLKFIIDRQSDNAVYFIDSDGWYLHFDWIWELIEGNAPFDLCVPSERQRHDAEWGSFSQLNYFLVDSRRFYLGTVVWYRDSDLYTVEFTAGDRITPAMMSEAFFAIAASMDRGKQLFLRPTTTSYEEKVLEIEGTLPIVPADKPFEGEVFQPLNPAVSYGVLTQVAADEIETAPLSYQSIVVLDRIPNDVPLVGGTITEAFQTPLAHVNVLAQNRGTPNMALKMASTDPRVAPFFGQLVRFEVTRNGFSIETATSSAAEAYWRSRFVDRPRLVPPRNLERRSIVDLTHASLTDIDTIGAKASQFAELLAIDWPAEVGGAVGACALTPLESKLPVPRPAYGIPFFYFAQHLSQNGIDAELRRLEGTSEFQTSPEVRRQELARIRDMVRAAPVDPVLHEALDTLLRRNFGDARVRFRSSTNVEDLVGFNGAGLYESKSAQVDSEVRAIDDTIREVWASVYSFRGYEERRVFNVDESQVAMGLLVHKGFPAEEANGVIITRNVPNPNSHGFYINAQLGEISVVNPTTGDLPEQLVYQHFNPPEIWVLGRSTATGGAPVMRDGEIHRLACVMKAVHNKFSRLYAGKVDPAVFAVDSEFKIDGHDRSVMIKQARPYTAAVPPDPLGCNRD